MPYVLFYELKNSLTGDIIFVRCFSHFKGYSFKNGNWGDDLNKYFIEYISGKKIAVLKYKTRLLFGKKFYSMIGSILGSFSLKNCVVYGTGLMSASNADSINTIPDKIISVRGPLTRQALIRKGIDCPRKYGDPALLLPLFYVPSQCQHGDITIVPNIGTFRRANSTVTELIERYGCKLVNMTRYEKWTNIIDEITGSSLVLSESLHGLIVAETYCTPCIWVEFTDHTTEDFAFNDDWSFKFLDFYESIGKHGMKSIKLYEGINFAELLAEKEKWVPGKIDYQGLLEDFPFEIKPELLEQIRIPPKL